MSNVLALFQDTQKQNEGYTVTPDDIREIKDQLKELTAAVTRLVLIEERISAQGQRIGAVEARISALAARQEATDRKVDSWVNRGIGVWAVVCTLFAVWQAWRAH